MMTDPIADMLTRIRNGLRIRKDVVSIPLSTLKVALAEVLKREGYIASFKVEGEGTTANLVVELKYGNDGEAVVSIIRRESRPGRRVYAGAAELRPVLNGLGISVVSTSKGLFSDRECREKNIGGEVLCTVW